MSAKKKILNFAQMAFGRFCGIASSYRISGDLNQTTSQAQRVRCANRTSLSPNPSSSDSANGRVDQELNHMCDAIEEVAVFMTLPSLYIRPTDRRVDWCAFVKPWMDVAHAC